MAWPFSKKAKAGARDKPEAVRRMLTPLWGRRSTYSLASNESIYSAVSRLANAYGSIPLHLYKDNVVQHEHALEQLVAHRPGPTLTPFMWRQTMEAMRLTEGNAYTFAVPAPGNPFPTRLDILDAAKVQPMVNRDDGELWYFCTLDDQSQLPLHSSMMVAVRTISTDGQRGIRPLDVLRETLDYDKDIKQFSINQLKSGVNTSLLAEVPTQLGKPQTEKAIHDLLDAYQSSNGTLVLLQGGMKVTKLDRSPVDAKVMDVEKITRNRVATVYNIPPHMLGDYTGVNFSSMEQEMIEFVAMSMLPIVTMYADELNAKLLTPQMWAEGYRFGHDEDVLLMADALARAQADSLAVRGLKKTPNEIRSRDGLPPLAGGDALYGSRDLAPIEQLTKGEEVKQ